MMPPGHGGPSGFWMPSRARSSNPQPGPANSGLTGDPVIEEPQEPQGPKDLRSRWRNLKQAVAGTTAALPRVIRLVWNGRELNRKVAPNGPYFPDVTFPSLDRSLRLPSPIALDNTRPQVERAAVGRRGAGVVVRYRFSEPAQAVLLVDGRRAILTRFAPTAGVVRWSGRFVAGRRLAAGRHTLELIAIDLAGNRSLPRLLGHYSGR